MLYFFDTSALVKRYRDEVGTEIIDEIFEETTSKIVICSVSICEVVRAIERHFRRQEINQSDFQKTVGSFYEDLRSERISILETIRERFFRANDLIIQHHLSANDAIILASAIALQDAHPIFVCADIRSGLLRAAEACQLSTLNPLNS